MGILSWILLGGIAGALASSLTGEDRGCLLNVVLGIIGAVVGGLVFSFLGGSGVTGCNIWSVVVATVGSLIVIGIARAFSGGSRHR